MPNMFVPWEFPITDIHIVSPVIGWSDWVINVQIGDLALVAGSENILMQRIELGTLRYLGEHPSTAPCPISCSSHGVEVAT